MANQGAKRRKEENARHIANLLRLIIGCNGSIGYQLLPPTKLLVSSKASCPRDSEGMEEDEKTRKKREKMEKKGSRPKFVKTRTR